MIAEIVVIAGYSLSFLSVAFLAAAMAMLVLGLYPLLGDEPGP